MIGQYCLNYKLTTKRNQNTSHTKSLPVDSGFTCRYLLIEINYDNFLPSNYSIGPLNVFPFENEKSPSKKSSAGLRRVEKCSKRQCARSSSTSKNHRLTSDTAAGIPTSASMCACVCSPMSDSKHSSALCSPSPKQTAPSGSQK